jgi:hypothetical protein
MELQQNLDLVFDVDAVLRGQGADASVLRLRRPGLVKVAEEAMHESLAMLHSKVVYQELSVQGLLHERLLLEGGRKLESKLIAQYLADSSCVVVLLATIGEELEQRVAHIWDDDMVYALALDSVGSAAVEALANAACQFIEKQAAESGMHASIPLNPGMIDWPVADGQPQIFQILGEAGALVQLTPSYIMVPKKSLTMVVGLGINMQSSGGTCDYCSMRDTCKYQKHNA